MANIMIVDDALFMRVTLKNMLEKAGHRIVAEASNGVEAVSRYTEVKPDIVTLDITMPEMDGLTALKKIVKNDPQAKVIMCSAMGQKTMVLEAVQSGAKDFLVKPFQEEKVLESIAKLTQ